MTKEELKFVIYTEYCKYNKLSAFKKVHDILEGGLKRCKHLIDIIYSDKEPDPIRFILNFNIMWKNLTKEEKLSIKKHKYDNRNKWKN